LGAAKDVTGWLRGWGGMKVSTAWDDLQSLGLQGVQRYVIAQRRSGWTSETGAIWTPNNKKGWSPIQNAFEHWKKHSSEFPQMWNVAATL